MRNYFIEKVLKEIPGSYLNGSKEKRSPNNINFRFDNAEGESLVLALDQEGIAASTGSACSSGALEPSRVLTRMYSRERALSSIRISLSKFTTSNEVEQLIALLKKTIVKLRK